MNSYQDTMRIREFYTRVYHWSLLVISVLFLYWNEVDGNEVQLRKDSSFCQHNVTAKTMSCNLEQQNGKLSKIDWKDVEKLTIINGSSVIILQQCASKEKTLVISNANGISAQPGDQINGTSKENCQVGLHLQNSNATSLVDPIFSFINIKQSRIDAVKLTVDQFHVLKDSYVGNFDILATSSMSSILNSVVDIVTRMHIQGNQKLKIEKSRLNKVKKLIYDSSYNKSIIKETEIEKIYAHGLEMRQGELTFESVTFTDLSSEAIVIRGGIIDLRDVRIEKANAKSIIMKGSGTIKFSNVSIGDQRKGQSFLIENNQNQELWPLAVVLGHNMAFSEPAVITISVLTGIFFIVIFVAITILYKYKKISCGNMKQNFLCRNSTHSQEVTQQTLSPNISSNVQNNTEVEEVDYTDVQSVSPPSCSVLPFNNASESSGLKFSSVAAKPPVNPMPHPLQNIKKDFDLKDSVPFEVNDDEEPIYENCESYNIPTHDTVIHDHHPLPVRNPHFLSNDKASLGLRPNRDDGFTPRSPRVHQSPQTSEEIKPKSFLYNNQRPQVPTKPNTTRDAPVMIPMRTSSNLPQKLPIQDINDRFGRLHNPALPIGGHHFDDNQDDPEEIYESIP